MPSATGPQHRDHRACSWNCVGPGTTSRFVPGALEGWVLRRCSRRCRVCRRSGPAGAPEALLGG
eukprot:10024503-Alexandrium_andersonii.AAC.1